MKGVKKFFFRGFLIMGFVWVFVTITEKEQVADVSEDYWLNEDSTKHPQDVARYDYENRLIYYRDYTPFNDSIKVTSSESEIDYETIRDLYED